MCLKSLYALGASQLGRSVATRLMQFITPVDRHHCASVVFPLLPGLLKLSVLHPRELYAPLTALLSSFMDAAGESSSSSPPADAVIAIVATLVELPILVDVVTQFGSLVCGVYCTSSSACSSTNSQRSAQKLAKPTDLNAVPSSVVEGFLTTACHDLDPLRPPRAPCRCYALRKLCQRFRATHTTTTTDESDLPTTLALFCRLTAHTSLSNKALYVSHLTSQWFTLIGSRLNEMQQSAAAPSFLEPLLGSVVKLLLTIPGPIQYVLDTQNTLMNLLRQVALPCPQLLCRLVLSSGFRDAFHHCIVRLPDSTDERSKKLTLVAFLCDLIARMDNPLSRPTDTQDVLENTSTLVTALDAWACETLQLASSGSGFLSASAMGLPSFFDDRFGTPSESLDVNHTCTTGPYSSAQHRLCDLQYPSASTQTDSLMSLTAHEHSTPAAHQHSAGSPYGGPKKTAWKSHMFGAVKLKAAPPGSIKDDLLLRLVPLLLSDALTLFCRCAARLTLPYPTLRVKSILLLSKIYHKAEEVSMWTQLSDTDRSGVHFSMFSIKRNLHVLAAPDIPPQQWEPF